MMTFGENYIFHRSVKDIAPWYRGHTLLILKTQLQNVMNVDVMRTQAQTVQYRQP